MAKLTENRCKAVLIATDTATNDGGVGRVVVSSAIALARAGVEVTIFTPAAAVAPPLSDQGIRVVTMGQTAPADDPNQIRGMARGIWNRAAARALNDLAGSMNPDKTVLHCHGFSKGLSPAIGPILSKGPLRAVYTMHEFFLACPNGGFFDFPRREICNRRPLSLACLSTNCDSRKAVHKAWRVARQVVLHTAGSLPKDLNDVIYISQTQKRVMEPFLAGPRLHHVSNPIHIDAQDRVLAEDNDTFLFVGRFAPDKGAVEFAHAARDAGCRAVFVGAGPQEDAIRAVLPDAEMTGWLSPEGVQEHMSRARCLVFPSLWYECQPLVPMEALTRGVPVITGAWSAATESVETNETGLFYEDQAGLVSAIRSMTPDRAGSMSRAAFARRSSIALSPADHAKALLRVYAQVLRHSD